MARPLNWLLSPFNAGHHANKSLLWKACQMSMTTTLVSLYTFIFLYLSVTSTPKPPNKSRPVSWLHTDQLAITPNETQLINLNNFRYILQPDESCARGKDGVGGYGEGMYFIVYIHSSPDHIQSWRLTRPTHSPNSGNFKVWNATTHKFSVINDFALNNPNSHINYSKFGFPYGTKVLGINSSPMPKLERRSIRSTWGSIRKLSGWGVKVVFLLGLTTDELQLQLQTESDQHKDIIQGNFVDSYRNLSYKHLMGYKWVLTNCPQTKFILKVDDDSFVDIIQLYNLLHEIYGDKPSGVLACSVWPAGSAPQREPNNKWVVDYKEYPYETYPTYCGGLAYVVSPDIAKELLAASLYVPFFWIDDLYVTGLLAEKIPRVRHHALNLRTTYDSHALLSWLREPASLGRPSPYIFGDINGSGNRSVTMHKLWRKTQNVWKNQKFNF